MARPREFDSDIALDAAIDVFRDHGYAGTSAEMLTRAMKIGRQSLYDTFGDKWKLYCAAVQRYNTGESQAHLTALKSGPKAIDGIGCMMERVVAKARMPCLGVGSISEFGSSREDLTKCNETSGRVLRAAFTAQVQQAQSEGDFAPSLKADHAAAFLLASIAAIRLAARGGARDDELSAIANLAMNALR